MAEELSEHRFYRFAGWHTACSVRHSLPVITETGRQLLLRRLLQEKEQQLKIFAGAARQPGFSVQLAVQIREFRHYRIEPEKLSAVSFGTECPEVLKSKVSDLHVIYSDYQDFVKTAIMTRRIL